jgi:hypothetical protein
MGSGAFASPADDQETAARTDLDDERCLKISGGSWTLELGAAFASFDRMRRRRNRSEYGTSFVSEQEVADAVENGRVMVDAVRVALMSN